MTALLRAELLKLRTTRTFAAVVGCAAALSLTLVVLGAALGKETKAHALFTNSAITYIIVILGAIAMTGEWRHRTITGSVLAAPNRGDSLARSSHPCSSLIIPPEKLESGPPSRRPRPSTPIRTAPHATHEYLWQRPLGVHRPNASRRTMPKGGVTRQADSVHIAGQGEHIPLTSRWRGRSAIRQRPVRRPSARARGAAGSGPDLHTQFVDARSVGCD